MTEGYILAAPWLVALLVWLWSGWTTVRYYRFANGDFPLSSALARINAICVLGSAAAFVTLFFLEASVLGAIFCYLLALGSIVAAFEVQRSGSFMHEAEATKAVSSD